MREENPTSWKELEGTEDYQEGFLAFLVSKVTSGELLGNNGRETEIKDKLVTLDAIDIASLKSFFQTEGFNNINFDNLISEFEQTSIPFNFMETATRSKKCSMS